MLVGAEVVNFVKLGESKSVEHIIGRPLFTSWTEFDRRFFQDGTYVRILRIDASYLLTK